MAVNYSAKSKAPDLSPTPEEFVDSETDERAQYGSGIPNNRSGFNLHLQERLLSCGNYGALLDNEDRMGRRPALLAMCVVSVAACTGFLRSASGFWMLLAGLCLAAFAYGGYLALMPSFTADYFGPRNVGANYGLVFSAWGVCGFLVPGYFAGVMDRARVAGDLAGGYHEVYWKLAVLAIVGAAVTAFLRPPVGEPK